ncbi:MAG: PilZ domain-containing protein [Myxococcota bacterium]|nr:PilZ domain-containing protein [Myxococcota bacterium]
MQEEGRAGSGDGAASTSLVVRYETPEELLDAFERELLHGALLAPAASGWAPGTRVEVVLELGFCDARVELASEVVAPRPAPLPEVAPGIALRLLGAPDDLRSRLIEASGIYLPESDPTPPGKRIRAPRFETQNPVEIDVEGRRFIGETANLSYNGMLALVPEADFANGTSLRLRIEAEPGGASLEIDGRVANQMPCDADTRALGVQFLYELDRFDEVSRFIDGLRSLQHARSLVTVTGSLREVPLETVLETAAGSSSEGTVKLREGDETGSIAYREGLIIFAVTGLETGEQALSRMFCWKTASFEVQPEVMPTDLPPTPLPLTSAMLLASVERDELARLDLGRIGPDTVFAVETERLEALRGELDELARELVDNAALGFPVAALLDMASVSDVVVYKTITELVDAGVLRLSGDAES